MKYKTVKHSIYLGALSLLAIIALSASKVQATTLADLLAGGSITENGLVFDNFHDYTPTASGASIIPASDIIVNLRDEVIGGVRETGLRFSIGGMFVTSGQWQDIIFKFDVSTVAPNPDAIIDDYLDVSGGTRGNGLLFISETIKNEEGFLDNLLVSQSKIGGFVEDSSTFAPQDLLHIIKDIQVFGGNGDACQNPANCTAAISDLSQLFSQLPPDRDIPEPSSMILLGLGMVGLRVVQRKRSAK